MGGNGNFWDYPQSQMVRQAGKTLIEMYMIQLAWQAKSAATSSGNSRQA